MKSFIKVLSLFFGIVLALGFISIFNISYVDADECDSNSDCEEGEICEGAEFGVGECVIGGDEDTCTSDSDCGTGAVCQNGHCMSGSRDDIGEGDTGDDCSSSSDCQSGLVCTDGHCVSGGSSSSSSGTSDYGLSNVPSQLRDIGEGDLVNVILRIIQYVVGLVGIILLVMFIYGGIMYMTAAGNEEQAGKAKKILTYAVIGIVIVAFSFVIAEFIVRALSGSSSSSSSTSSSGTTSGSRLPSGSDSGSDD